MSQLPPELRDEVARRYESALADRDRQLSRLRSSTETLQQMQGTLEAQLRSLNHQMQQQSQEIARANQQVEEERQKSLGRLKNLEREMSGQLRRIEEQLADARAQHQRDWDQLEAETQRLADRREARERQIRKAAEQALGRAESVLAALEPVEAEALDLAGQMMTTREQVRSAQGLVKDNQVGPQEMLSAGYAAEEASRQVAGQARYRRALLVEHLEKMNRDADLLESLLRGEPLLGYTDQRADMTDLLELEMEQLLAMMNRFLRKPAAGLSRWNGHAALLAKLEGIYTLLATEVITTRTHLPAAVAHEEVRYRLDHVEDDLVIRFGGQNLFAESVAGAWSNPRDHKSTFYYFLKTPAGEVRVEIPWLGNIQAHFEGAKVLELKPWMDSSSEPGVHWMGSLRERWRQLATVLENPNWEPN